MSCNKCVKTCGCDKPKSYVPERKACEESRLDMGISQDGTLLVGRLDGIPFLPVGLGRAVKSLETVTNIYFDTDRNGIVYVDEEGKEHVISATEILSNSSIEELTGIDELEAGGLASAVEVDGTTRLTIAVPPVLPSSQRAQGFVVYVPNVAPGEPHYKLIAPQTGANNSVMVGRPDGSIEFAPAINSPRLLSDSGLDSNGRFNGTPAASAEGVVRSRMGQFPDIVNTDSSPVQVDFVLRMSFTSDGAQGAYARLENAGANFVTNFVEGVSAIDQTLGRGGVATWSVVLGPGQSTRMLFGVWSAGQAVNCVLGNFTSGTPKLVKPYANVRRLI